MDESKLAPNLFARLQETRIRELGAPRIPVIIRYRRDILRSQIIKEGMKARYVFRLTPTVAATATGTDILELTDVPTVDYIWLDEEVHACLEQSVPVLGVPTVWAEGYRGAGIKVAIVDTGIDRQHPDFAGRIVDCASFVADDDADDCTDDNGHGTHVASILAGTGVESGGRYRGVAPEATLYIAKVLDRYGSGSMSDVMAGVEWAVDQKVQIINLSLGGSESSDGQDALSLTCNAAVARRIIVCVASGNGGPGYETVGSPGAATDVVTVGAVDRANEVAPFSSRGPTADGRLKPDLCFPGVDIVAARAAGTTLGSPVNDGYTASSGSSMATPYASGLSALLLQAEPDLTPMGIKLALMQTALTLGEDKNAYGAGLGQAIEALAHVHHEPVPDPEPEPEPGPDPQPPDDGGKKGCLPTFLMPLLGR